MKKRANGFTLIEVLVAATIIALLASVAVSSYTSINRSSRDARRKTDLEQLRAALEMHRSTVGYYPVALSSLETDYIVSLPHDPKLATGWSDYSYVSGSCTGSACYMFCLAADMELASSAQNQCSSPALPGGYDYGVRNP